MVIVETEITPQSSEADVAKKRKTETPPPGIVSKKRKTENNIGHDDDDICIIEDSDTDMQCVYQKNATPTKQSNDNGKLKSPEVDQVANKRTPQKHKPSTDDECLIVYDEGDDTPISPKRTKSQKAE